MFAPGATSECVHAHACFMCASKVSALPPPTCRHVITCELQELSVLSPCPHHLLTCPCACSLTGPPSLATQHTRQFNELQPPQVRTTRAGIIDYFSTFLKLSPQGKVDQSQIRMLSPNLALHSGVYSFTLDDDGKMKIVQVQACLCVALSDL